MVKEPRPGLMVPCQKAMAGSLTPPSYVVAFPHFRGPAFPPRDIRHSSGLHTQRRQWIQYRRGKRYNATFEQKKNTLLYHSSSGESVKCLKNKPTHCLRWRRWVCCWSLLSSPGLSLGFLLCCQTQRENLQMGPLKSALLPLDLHTGGSGCAAGGRRRGKVFTALQ